MSSYPAAPSQWSSGGAPSGPEPVRRGVAYGYVTANWPRRSLSTLIDFSATIWLPALVLNGNSLLLAMIVLIGANSVFMQARTGQSLGKVLLGLQIIWPVRNEDHVPIGAYPSMLRNATRICLHVVDLFFFIGFLRPLWDWHRQTFADEKTKVLVLAQRPLLTMRPAPKGAQSLL